MFKALTPFFKSLKLVEALLFIFGQENNSRKSIKDYQQQQQQEEEEEGEEEC